MQKNSRYKQDDEDEDCDEVEVGVLDEGGGIVIQEEDEFY